MAEKIDYKLELDAKGKQSVEELLKELKKLEESLGENATRGAKKLRNEIAKLKSEVLGINLKDDFGKAAFGGIEQRVKGIGREARKLGGEFSFAENAANLLDGDTKTIKENLKAAVQRTQAWERAVSKVGIAKLSGAMSFAVVGINRAVAGFQRMLEIQRKFNEERRDGDLSLNAAAGRNAQDSFAASEARRGLASRTAEIESGVRMAKMANRAAAEKSAIDNEMNFALAGTTGEREKEKIVREAEWKKREVEMRLEMASADEKIQQALFRQVQAREKNAEVQGKLDVLNRAYGKADKAMASSESRAEAADSFLGTLAEGLGANYLGSLIGKDGPQQIRERLSKARDVVAEIASIRKEFEQKIRAGGADQHEADAAVKQARLDRSSIEAAHGAERYGRENQELDADRRYALEDEQWRFDLSERERRSNEADLEAENADLDGLSTYKEKKARIEEKMRRNEAEFKKQEALLKSVANGRDVTDLNGWKGENAAMDRRQAQRAMDRMQELKDRERQLVSEKRGLERQGNAEGVSLRRNRLTERRRRDEENIDALNQWAVRVGGPMAAYGVSQRNYERRKEQYDKAKADEKLFSDRIRAKYKLGENASLMGETAQARMTQAERQRFSDLRGDTLDYESKLRSARYERMGTDFDRRTRAAEFRQDAMRQGNRLTAMGLGGDVSADFAKNTAGNTKELVVLAKAMLKTFQVGRQGRRIGEGMKWMR